MNTQSVSRYAVFLSVFFLLDLFLTVFVLHLGADEFNPLMNFFIVNCGIMLFVLFKLSMNLGSLFLLEKAYVKTRMDSLRASKVESAYLGICIFFPLLWGISIVIQWIS